MSGPFLVDVSDLLEFYGRSESSSGVQRVIEGVLPHLLSVGAEVIALDRSRGVFVPIDAGEFQSLVGSTTNREDRAHEAQIQIHALRARPEISCSEMSTILFLGAVWISDATMLAAWKARYDGARLVFFLYDLTPVLEAGHTAAVNMLFDRYLNLISSAGSRVPAISQSTRRDFEDWCRVRHRPTPDGSATGLPNGLNPEKFPASVTSPWPRSYALMVGTVESRKNHEFALRAWSRLIEERGRDAVPDLVCIGRLGWHVDKFLGDFYATRGLEGKIHLLTSSVSDEDLASYYRHCDFTIYPSRYEGWGLPISESLAFGKVTIAAKNSSLPEAGGDTAVYFVPEDVEDFVSQVEAFGLDKNARLHQEQLIRSTRRSEITWQQVADQLIDEVRRAQEDRGGSMADVEISLGREYVFGPPPSAPDGAHADQYVAFLTDNARTPLLSQMRDPRDFEVTDRLVTGQFGIPQAWGLELHPDRQIRIGLQRPVDGPLSVLLATRSMPGKVRVTIVSPAGDVTEDVYLGSVLRVDLGSGRVGETALAYVTVNDASDSVEGFLGIRSAVLLRSDDHELETAALRASAQALRQEIDFLTGTRSWKLTAPLRRRWGRGGGR